MEPALIPWIFAAMMTAGVVFLLASVFLGGITDADVDMDVDSVTAADGAETRQIGCSVVAAFLAGFGAVGLLGSLADWGLPLSLAAALVFGLLTGRGTMAALDFVMRQQSNDLLRGDSLVGEHARITVDTPPGRTGEAIIEGHTTLKYPVRAVSDEEALSKGDYVEIIEVQGGRLYVKKKRM